MRDLDRMSWLPLALFLLGACGGDKPAPTVAISVSPTTVASGGTISIAVMVTDFDLRAPPVSHGLRALDTDHEDGAGESGLSPNEGHYHVYLDTVEENPLLMSYATQVDVSIDAEPGPHEVIVRLNHDDHTAIVPHVLDRAPITVE